MISPGIKNLGAIPISANDTYVGEWVDGFDGMLALNLQVKAFIGGGGGTAKVYVQTTIDQETTPVDVACFTFTTSSAVKIRNLSGLTPKTTDITPSDGALADDTSVDGVFGDRFRFIVKTSSTAYSGSSVISVMADAR